MKLIHRTNYWGEYIDASDRDRDVSFNAIWVQAVGENWGCCRGFGRRCVVVQNNDFTKEHDGLWNIFLISEQSGSNEGHYFYKFVALPKNTYGYGKKNCAKLKWQWVGEFNAYTARENLDDVLEDYLDENKDDSDDDVFYHVHIGIKMNGKLHAPKG